MVTPAGLAPLPTWADRCGAIRTGSPASDHPPVAYREMTSGTGGLQGVDGSILIDRLSLALAIGANRVTDLTSWVAISAAPLRKRTTPSSLTPST